MKAPADILAAMCGELEAIARANPRSAAAVQLRQFRDQYREEFAAVVAGIGRGRR